MYSHSRIYLFIYSNNKQTFEELVNTVINMSVGTDFCFSRES